MSDDVFNIYENYSIINRSDLIISKKWRNQHPLCTVPKKDEIHEGFDAYDADNITWVYLDHNHTSS